MHRPLRTDSNRALNDVLVTLHRSLPAYLAHAAPWVAYGNEDAQRSLDRIVAEKNEHVRRLSELLDARRHTIDRGEFPMDFTSLHDVSLSFVVGRLVEHQRRDVQAIESRLEQMTGDTEGRALVEDILGSARRHLQTLEGLARQPEGVK